MSLPWFLNLAFPSYAFFSFILLPLPPYTHHKSNLLTSTEIHSLKNTPGLGKIIINLIGWYNYIK
jgi:hypothetical protein